MTATYQIADEPRASGLARIVVNPIWPLFSFMFCRPWLAFPWFVLNGWALGSPSLRKEAAIAGLGLAVGALVMWLALGAASGQWAGLPTEGSFDRETFAYLNALRRGLQLAAAYALMTTQAPAFALWEYYGGKPGPGFVGVIAGAVLDERVADAAVDLNSIWVMGLL